MSVKIEGDIRVFEVFQYVSRMYHDSGQKNSYETKLLEMKTVIGTALKWFSKKGSLTFSLRLA